MTNRTFDSFPQQNRPVTMAPHGLVASPHYLASAGRRRHPEKGWFRCRCSHSHQCRSQRGLSAHVRDRWRCLLVDL